MKTNVNMGNSRKIELPQKFIDYLAQLPEQGMGYQLVDIELSNGEILKGRMVFNATYLQIDRDEKIVTDQIKDIKLHTL